MTYNVHSNVCFLDIPKNILNTRLLLWYNRNLNLLYMGKNKENKGYIIVSLKAIKYLIMDENKLTDILFLGLYRYSRAIEVDISDAISKAHHDYYHLCSGYLPDTTKEMFNQFEYDIDNDEIIDFLERNPEYYEPLVEWYRMYKVCKSFNISVDYRAVLQCVERNKDIYNSIGSPTFCVNAAMMIDRTIDKYNSTPDTRAKLAMYLGILTIVGENDYFKSSSGMVKCRMFGCKNKAELNEALKEPDFKEAYETYTTRRRYDRYLRELQEDGVISEFGYCKNTYLSVKLNLDELAKRIAMEIKKKESNPDKKAKAELLHKYLG